MWSCFKPKRRCLSASERCCRGKGLPFYGDKLLVAEAGVPSHVARGYLLRLRLQTVLMGIRLVDLV